MTSPSPEERAALRQGHRSHEAECIRPPTECVLRDSCSRCAEPWPCPMIRLLDVLKEAEKTYKTCENCGINAARLEEVEAEIESHRRGTCGNAELREAIGLATTAIPTMEMDVADPIGMMQQVVERVRQLEAALRQIGAGACLCPGDCPARIAAYALDGAALTPATEEPR